LNAAGAKKFQGGDTQLVKGVVPRKDEACRGNRKTRRTSENSGRNKRSSKSGFGIQRSFPLPNALLNYSRGSPETNREERGEGVWEEGNPSLSGRRGLEEKGRISVMPPYPPKLWR